MLRFKLHNFMFATLLLAATPAVAASYQFVNIADSRGPFDSFLIRRQAVSDTGLVAFIGYQASGVGSYVGDGTITNLVADLSPADGFSNFDPLGYYGLNESGAAVNMEGQCCDGGHGIARIQLHDATGSRTVRTINTNDAHIGGHALNNSGHVAVGVYYDINRLASLERWFDGASTTVVDFSNGIGYFLAMGLNEQGDVAFLGVREFYDPGFRLEYTYYRTDGTTMTLIADDSGPLSLETFDFSNFGHTAINDLGAVAFYSRLDSGGEGIFAGDGGPLTTVAIADPTTPYATFGEDVAINNQGTVAFFGRLWDGRSGIFTGPDPVSDKVVEIGDFLFGQSVIGLGRPHLNERGDVAFWYAVQDPLDPDDKWTGIALAVKQPSLPGDYDQNGIVDTSDYVVWRKNPGSFPADAYDTWRANFGQTAGSGAGTTSNAVVPEPASACLLLVAAAAGSWLRRRPVRVCHQSR